MSTNREREVTGEYLVGICSQLKAVIILQTVPSIQDTLLLQHFVRGLRNMTLEEIPEQAIPITREELQEVARRQAPDVRAALHLAWKTAARWDDIANLRTSQITPIGEGKMLINFMVTKSRERFRADHALIVVMPKWLQEFLTQRIQRTSEDDQLSGRSDHVFEMSTIQAERVLKPWTAHSIKRGALQELARCCEAGKLPWEAVTTMARHKNPAMKGAMANTTVRYLGPLYAALANGSEQATAAL